MKKLLILVLALVVVVTMLAVPVAADGPADYDAAVKDAADRLVDLQGTDGGWDWIVTDLTAHSGTYPSAFNLFGVTALGLIDAYQVTGDEAYKTAAKVTADYLKTLDRATDPAVRIMSFDYRFLVESSALFDDPSYKAHAIGQWSVAKTASEFHYADGNQENIYDFWYTWTDPDSHGYAAWQAGDMGMATLAMGDTSWASNMAAVLAGHLDEIATADVYRFIGWGHALELLNAVDSVAYSAEITNLITSLTGSQTNGSWPGTTDQGTVQNTAYVVMGLAAAGEGATAQAGADWLVENQITSGDSIGGWIETDSVEYSEVDSEALQAIKSVLEISGSVSVTANIPAKVCISVDPTSIDYGTITVPFNQSDTLTVSNCGTVGVTVTHEVVGDTLFTSYLTVNPVSRDIGVSSSSTFSATLDVPGTYTPQGVETGTIILWAEQM